ncbi:MAG TPA: DUF222 domain-containing protein [Polyangia bacterium]|jgi:hypothetical protein
MTNDTATLEQEIATLAAQLTSATARLLDCIRAYDASEAWATQGFRSCAAWLSWRIGLDLRAAREHVRVARALAALPRLQAALAEGTLSYSKVRALSRIARPETEEDLLTMGRDGTAAQIERLVRGYRRVEALENPSAVAQVEGRYVQTWHDEQGMLVVEARLPPEQGALLLQALAAAEHELWAETRQPGSAEPPRRPPPRGNRTCSSGGPMR